MGWYRYGGSKGGAGGVRPSDNGKRRRGRVPAVAGGGIGAVGFRPRKGALYTGDNKKFSCYLIVLHYLY